MCPFLTLIYLCFPKKVPVPTVASKPTTSKGIDLEAEGTINGVGVYSYDLDEISDKPWLKPGMEIILCRVQG